ncbi:MAG: hypothetical protein ABI208_00085 [Ginsengibacter sp.]
MTAKQKTLLLLFSLVLFVFSSFGQLNSAKIEKQVLAKEIIDSVFVFGKWTEENQTENHLKYLDQVKTRSGHTFKIMNSIWLWGLSKRATSKILIYNLKNQYVGHYYFALTNHLPTSLRGGKLIFTNQGNDCDKNSITIINLKHGLPKQFFRKCTGNIGHIYSFESNWNWEGQL